MKVKVKVSHSDMPSLCDPMDCSPPDSSVHEILQARILEWFAISSHIYFLSYSYTISYPYSYLLEWTRGTSFFYGNKELE